MTDPDPTSPPPLRVGLVGAGPWAQIFTAPLLAAGPHCALAAVWARRADAAEALAARHGVPAAHDLDQLFASCDAVAFAVPPDVQAELAACAVRAGRHVLLEKPIAMTLAGAEALADAVGSAGVRSQVVLTNRYLPSMREFLAGLPPLHPFGGRAAFFGGGAIPGSWFGTPWRLEQGALLDLGPHALDAVDAALGHVTSVRASGDSLRMVAITCEHETGAVSQISLSATSPVDPGGLVVEIVGRGGVAVLDTAAGDAASRAQAYGAAMANLTAEFAATVRGEPHPLDVHRGLHLQRLLDRAQRELLAA